MIIPEAEEAHEADFTSISELANENNEGSEPEKENIFNEDIPTEEDSLSIDLRIFDVPCSNKTGKKVNYKVYYSQNSSSFWFQLAFLEFQGLRTLAITDEQLLLGEILCPSKVSTQAGSSHKVDRSLYRSLMSYATLKMEPIQNFSYPPDSESLGVGQTFELDRFLPNDEGFGPDDYDQLEKYLEKKPGPTNYARGVIEKSKKNYIKANKEWCRGADIQKCIPSLSLYLRSRVAIDSFSVSNTVAMIVDVAIHSGIYYTTQIDRLQNHASLIYNLAVLLDCDPELRSAIVQTVKPLVIEELSEEKSELFRLEKAIWAKPSYMRALVLYLVAEFHRMDKKYFLALTFLEYFVMIENESSQYGLILADLLEYQQQDQDITQKLLTYYMKAYRYSNSYISSTALARISVIYERNFQKVLTEQPTSTEVQMLLYKDLMETHSHLIKIYRPESMRFKLNHYLKCLCFATNEKKHVTISQREIDNLIMNRKLSLETSLEFFQFFYYMGERGKVLTLYFEVLDYLCYKESSLAAIRISVLNSIHQSFGKRNYYLALCAKRGIGMETDLKYAFNLLDNYYMELSSSLTQANNFELAMCLTHIADIVESKQKDINPSKLRRFALLFAMCSEECKNMTNKFVYELSLMLKKVAYLPSAISEDTIERDLVGTEDFVIDLWEKGFYLPCTTEEDYIYHYRIEKAISQNLYQFDSLSNVKERLTNTSLDRSRYLSELTKISVSSVDPSEIRYVEQIKKTIETVKAVVTKDGKLMVSTEFVKAKVSPELQKCGEFFQKLNFKEMRKSMANQRSGERLTNPAVMSLRRIARVLTITTNWKEQAKKSAPEPENDTDEYHPIVDFRELSQAIQTNLLLEAALETVKKYENIRIFHHSELVVDELDPIGVVYDGTLLFDGHFKSNKQKCKVFRIEIDEMKRLNTFMENLVWIGTASPYILNYYGIRFLVGKAALTIDIVSEYFDSLCLTPDPTVNRLPTKPWADPLVSIKERYQMLEDLMLAVKSLHFIGKPHLTLTASHFAIYRGNRLKVIIPFFEAYFNDFSQYMKGVQKHRNASACSTVYLSPRLVNKPLSPRYDFEVFHEDLGKAADAFIKSDIWSIGVFLLEMLTERSFACKLIDYQSEISRKWKVEGIVKQAIKEAKEKNPKARIPSVEIEKLMNNNHMDRPDISTTMKIVTDFMKRDFSIEPNIDSKQEKKAFIKNYFIPLSFIAGESTSRSGLQPPLSSASRAVTLHLINNLEFYGCINGDNLPQGRCVIKHNRNIVMDAEFWAGLPSSSLTLVNTKGEKVELTFDDEICTGFTFSTSLSERGKLDLTSTLDKKMLSPNFADIGNKFEMFAGRKGFSELMKDMNSDIKKSLMQTDKPENVLDNLAQKLLGSHRDSVRRNVRRRTVTKTMIDELKYLGLSSDDSSSEEDMNPKRFQTPGKKNEFKDDKKLSEMQYDEIIDQVDKMCSLRSTLSEQLESNTTWRKSEEERKKQHKKFVEYVDPFGYRYQLEYKTYYEKVQYNAGFNRISYRLESLTEVLTYRPQFSYFKFLVTDLFEFRFMESPKPLTTFPSLYFQTLMSNNYGNGIVIDQIGNMYKGRFHKSALVAGEILGTESRCMKVKGKIGDRYNGLLLLSKEQMTYQGETDHLSFSGYGTLLASSGKKVFIGNFEDDLPHGYGVMYDKYGKLSKDGFSGFFCSGIKQYGVVEDENMELEGNFSRPIPFQNRPENNLGTRMNLTETLQFNQKSFNVTGWMLSKNSRTIKFGNFKDAEPFLTGLYRVNYPDGSVYKGKFTDSLREGDFIMITAYGDHLIGTWNDNHFTGVILWNSDSHMSYSLGKFELNEDGEIEQSHYGDIRTKDGSFYQGEIANSRFNGYGTLRKQDGSYYKGFFKEGFYSDVGEELNVSDRTLYQGEFNSNFRHGVGMLHYLDKSLTIIESTVKGYFEEGVCLVQYNQQTEHNEKIFNLKIKEITMNVLLDERTNKYEQTGYCLALLEKKPEDKEGTVYKYEGEVQEGKITGNGTITRRLPEDKNDTNIYEGQFEDGYLRGLGRLNIKIKTYYKGEFAYNSCKGIGVIKDANDVHEGYFCNLEKDHSPEKEVCIVSLKRERCRIGMYSKGIPDGYHLVKETANTQDRIGSTISTKVVLYNYKNGCAERMLELPNRGWFDF